MSQKTQYQIHFAIVGLIAVATICLGIYLAHEVHEAQYCADHADELGSKMRCAQFYE